MNVPPAIAVRGVSHHYGQHQALRSLDVEIAPGEIFAFVGPNGGGKTTLFRLLSTLVPMQSGEASVLGLNLKTQVDAIRAQIGVVFQAPSLDKKLTVGENLRHQGHLYGLSGKDLRSREDEMLDRLGLTDRRNDKAEQLSGGLRRRVELAKGMLHRPRLLLLDEPSTALDPVARSEMWQYLESVRAEDGVTVVLTTHLLDEAERADRVAILHQGSLVALDTPEALRSGVGGDAITIVAEEAATLAGEISAKFDCKANIVDGSVRLEQPNGHQMIARLVEAFPGQIESITFARPTLEDVFIDRTGHRFRDDIAGEEETKEGVSHV